MWVSVSKCCLVLDLTALDCEIDCECYPERGALVQSQFSDLVSRWKLEHVDVARL